MEKRNNKIHLYEILYAVGRPKMLCVACSQCGKDSYLTINQVIRVRHFEPSTYCGNSTCTNCGKVKSFEGFSLKQLFETFPLYYQISTRYGTIWALNLGHLISLKEIIESKSRSESPQEKDWPYPRIKHGVKLPSWMLSYKNREYLSKTISKFLTAKT